MAFRAVQDAVRAFKPEPGHRFMIPLGGLDIFPSGRGMAIAAMDPELEPVAVVLPPLPVAGFAGPRRSLEDPLEMAFPAGNHLVLASQRKIGPVMTLGGPFGLVLLQGRGGALAQEPKA